MNYLWLYVRVGVSLAAINMSLTAISGASFQQALIAEARKSLAPRHRWGLLIVYTVMLWPVNLAYTLSMVLGILPRKTWQELNDE